MWRGLERVPMATQWCEEEEVWVTQQAPGLLEVTQDLDLLEEVLVLLEEVVESPQWVAMQGSLGML